MKIPTNYQIDMSNFKTDPCPILSKHNIKKCIYYHFQSEKRRDLKKIKYSKMICKNLSNCYSNYCKYSHNTMEQLYHPENYKKKYCKSFYENKNCKFGEFCALAHSEEELEIILLHKMEKNQNFFLFYFKSEFCPFSKINHDKFKCDYAHNWQDFKRPFCNFIKPTLCENWVRTKKLDFYNEGCKNGMNCEKCHGWKELDYHICNFKKKKCLTKNCKRNQICCFYHSKNEKKLYNLKNLNFISSSNEQKVSPLKLSKIFSEKMKRSNNKNIFIDKKIIGKKDSCTSLKTTCEINTSLDFPILEKKQKNLKLKNINIDLILDLEVKNNTKSISHKEKDSSSFNLHRLIDSKNDNFRIEKLFYMNSELIDFI